VPLESVDFAGNVTHTIPFLGRVSDPSA